MIAAGPGASAGLVVRLAGDFAVGRDGRDVPVSEIGSRKARQLLKYLAVERANKISVDRIAAVLWPEAPPQQPAENVATLVSRLRAALGPDVIDGDRTGYRLAGPPDVAVDLSTAGVHVAEARRRAAGGQPALALAAAQAALEIVGGGTALADEPYADWAEPARAELARVRTAARYAGAQAAVDLGDHATATALAAAATEADPYDEQAARLLMRAETAAGQPGRALAAYERLRALLADEFGVDPAPQTRDVHTAILREQPATAVAGDAPAAPVTPTRSPADPTDLVGRRDEVDALAAAWAAATAGRPALVLVTGEAGIGKTRLAAEVTRLAAGTGGTVLAARCYSTERSLFLQPIVDALGQHAARSNPAELRRLAGEAAGPLALLVPEIAAVLGAPAAEAASPEIQLARLYRGVAQYLYRLTERPVLLVLDDLHQAGLATVELLHHVMRQATTERLLIVATVRGEEGAAVLDALAGVATTVELGPLPRGAVDDLATAAGHGALADTIMARTGGHTLFVVETLRALAAGDPGIPASLHAAVLARVQRAGVDVAELLRAAAVLGSSIDPDLVARMLDITPSAATKRCEEALAARLLAVADRAYEFANDLVREVLYANMPAPTRVVYHRRAADLLESRPEALAGHAAAAGDPGRAARAWLFAGEDALHRFAVTDADALIGHALTAAAQVDDLEVTGRARLARGRVRYIIGAFTDAVADLTAAAAAARQAGDRRLEMLALAELGGDVRVALRAPVADSVADLERGLGIAAALGDRAAQAAMLGRLAVMAGNRLDFVDALDHAERALRIGRASNDERALLSGLDGMKHNYAYLGEIGPLVEVLDELLPIVRARGALFHLQWAVLESGFPALAAGAWAAATDAFAAALDINRRSGHVTDENWFLANLGWVHRLAGDLDTALDYGRRSMAPAAATAVHPWWRAGAAGLYGTTLMAAGDPDTARDVLAEGCTHATHGGAEAYLLRCLAPLAEVTGDPAVVTDCDRRFAAIRTRPGAAWLIGAEAYLSLGRAWSGLGEPDRARVLLAPLRAAAVRTGWSWIARAVDAVAPDAMAPDAVAPGAGGPAVAPRQGSGGSAR